MKRSRMLKAITSHIDQNNGVWDFTNDEGKPMGYIAVGKENFPVRDLALDLKIIVRVFLSLWISLQRMR